MENSVKTYDLRAYGIPACSEVWAMETGAWCEVREFLSASGAIDVCYLASGFGIISSGQTRRIVCGGSIWCGTSEGKRNETVIVSGHARLYGLRILAPKPNVGWCGLGYEYALRTWRIMQLNVRSRPIPVGFEIEAGWQELLANVRSPDVDGAMAMVCMAFGGLVSRSAEAMRCPSEGQRMLKSNESALAYLETCAIRKLPTIDKLAPRIGYCAGHLMKSFHSAFGITLKQCMDMIRCEHAIRLIRAGGTIQDVTASCGFSGLVAFRKTFARQFGMSMADYRARCGIKHSRRKVLSPVLRLAQQRKPFGF